MSKLTYIHMACEVIVIGIVFLLVNRRITSLQVDLVECAVRIASQNKKIHELEEKVEELTHLMTSNIMSQMAMPPMNPFIPKRQEPIVRPSEPVPPTPTSTTSASAPSKVESVPDQPSEPTKPVVQVTESFRNTPEPSESELDAQIADEINELSSE